MTQRPHILIAGGGIGGLLLLILVLYLLFGNRV